MGVSVGRAASGAILGGARGGAKKPRPVKARGKLQPIRADPNTARLPKGKPPAGRPGAEGHTGLRRSYLGYPRARAV